LVKETGLSADEKIAVWEDFARKMNQWSNEGWDSHRHAGADGSTLFIGNAGEALVITPAGELYRGSFRRDREPAGGFSPDYGKMTKLMSQ
jgi:hypothetical protein